MKTKKIAPKLHTPADLERLRDSLAKRRDPNKPTLTVCAGTGCKAFGGERLIKAFQRALKSKKLEAKVQVVPTGCHGFCEQGPLVVVSPQGIFYPRVKSKDVAEIISKTVLNGKIIDRLLYVDPVSGKKITHEDEIPFYKQQKRMLLAQNGHIDPTLVSDYISLDGYAALSKALFKLTPEKIIKEVKTSGLRGRGGAGFPTGLKWEIARKQPGDVKYVICNADEGDPGAYMDRSLLESNPHSVVEGMIIGAFGIGANEGWIYVRHEYPLAIKHFWRAVEQARELGLLGKNILGSGFDFDIKMAKGAGSFVCGEETALITSIVGKRGIPQQRPPFPAQRGLFGKPTNINNVETWANVPLIIKNGGAWYSAIGTETSKGTKIFSLVGKVRNTGLVEVPMGIPLKRIVFDIGGGVPKGRKVKAVQIGGPSGGCLPADLFHLPVDYESLKEAGTIMGSGGMIVLDEGTCMVDIAKYFMNFLKEESCGKCSTCREGTQRMHEILTRIAEGRGDVKDLELLEELGNVVKDASMCGLGQTAANPVLGTLRYFRDEYLAHIQQKRCPAAVCTEIISSSCQHTCPIDTEAPNYISLIAHGRHKEALETIKKDNPLSSTLARVCHHPCEAKCRAGEGGEPISIRNLKRFVTDYGLKNRLMLKAKAVPKNQKAKVAVIGSGPAGLGCAFELRQKGYGVTIFEKLPVLGGMLAVGIPEYRLPRDILKADIDYVTSAGINVKTNTALGKDFSIKDLFKKGYKAVFIATGAHNSMKLGIPGEDAGGVYPSIQFLASLNLGKEVKIGARVGIIGGGNSAVDAARLALRTGIPERVTIFYRRTIAEMPAYKEEVEAALEEGIDIKFLTAPKRIRTKNGKLSGCKFVKMRLGDYDASGRRRPVAVEGSEFTVELDTLIVAISERPDTSFAKGAGLPVTKWDSLEIDPETFATQLEGVFAGGDVVTGPNTVVDAVAAGKVAADSIHQYISSGKIKREYRTTRPSQYLPPLKLSEKEQEELLELARPAPQCLDPLKRKCSFDEVELVLDKKSAIKEARRCLCCDLETSEGKAFLEGLKTKQGKK